MGARAALIQFGLVVARACARTDRFRSRKSAPSHAMRPALQGPRKTQQSILLTKRARFQHIPILEQYWPRAAAVIGADEMTAAACPLLREPMMAPGSIRSRSIKNPFALEGLTTRSRSPWKTMVGRGAPILLPGRLLASGPLRIADIAPRNVVTFPRGMPEWTPTAAKSAGYADPMIAAADPPAEMPAM
jgi:hypothetical protein